MAILDSEVFLVTAGDVLEAEIIEGLLKSHDIPVDRKHQFNTEWMTVITGNSRSGIDIYVPTGFYDKAKEILNAELHEEFYNEEIADNGNVIDSKEVSELLSKSTVNRKINNWKYYGVIIIVLIIVLLVYAIGDLVR